MIRLFSVCFAVAALLFSFGSTPVEAQRTKILVREYLSQELSALTDLFPQLELITAANSRQMVEKVSGCAAVIGSVNSEVVRAGNTLEWVQVLSAGVEGYVNIPELVESNIVLTNGKIIQGPEIADHAMALLLTLTRNLKQFNERMNEAEWGGAPELPMVELRGKTALIIGLGGIGTQVAERAEAFGMNVIAVDPKDIPLSRTTDYVGKPDELDNLLPVADVVISCVPRTPQTEDMLNSRQFDLMKDGVYIINISRGRIINTDALVAALRSGKVRGAGLDVTDPEPLPEGHPLWSMPNVIITPHVAGSSDQIGDRRMELIKDNIARFLTDRPLRNVVDKEKGY